MLQVENVDHYFNKKFSFRPNSKWSLPREAYKHPPEPIESLRDMKVSLNACKGQLNRFALTEWSNHTKFTDPSSSIIETISSTCKVELLTQAWCKFYECLYNYPIVSRTSIETRTLNSLHLCEAPGAFISALNYFLYAKHPWIKWRWRASTLNPYYEGNSLDEMIYDDRLIRRTLPNWEFGPDLTGDLRTLHNHESVVASCEGIMLVTADGSTDCSGDPGEQERHVHFLHYCEVMTALKVLGVHGNFVLKLFTMFEHETVSLMFLLNCLFLGVHVFKPCASKSGNSEVYVVCLDYRGYDTVPEVLRKTLMLPYGDGHGESVMFPLDAVSCDFVRQVEDCARLFMNWQRDHINSNVEMFRTEDEDVLCQIRNRKESVAGGYVRKFRIPKGINKRRRLMRSGASRFVHEEEPCSVALPELTIKTGRAVSVVYKSEFGHVTPKIGGDDLIFAAIKSNLPDTYASITGACFSPDDPQHVMQREFLSLVRKCLDCSCDIVIYGVALLTRFLVGVVYILASGFESFVTYESGAILFSKRRDSIDRIKGCFDEISQVYASLKGDKFPVDILEVVDKGILKRGHFYKAISEYNKGLCR
ncbi:hypothetical protein PPYR_03276 [Photinus pyralis]|uniref:Cap-specific mRNA (nucleoside-2'-O-)-methyltransferase 2 n=2 Tax=Photinus pyralis TaxID=7054 RepID=A0A5N4A2E7_PHOPY|nr:hypothetical protein PPYR_03276 [Photinus pyralis]